MTDNTALKYDFVTLGETMWRLSPPGFERLETTRSLDINIGGAESNVAIALARLGKRVAWWSKLPDNGPGRNVADTLRFHGVDVSGVQWGGKRLGTYFVEFGSPPRPTQVIYDRADSAASQMRAEDFDWSLLKHSRWLHLTGITPALSESCLETTRRAVHEARAAKIPLSFDLNYRAKLWTPEQAAPVYDEIAGRSTVVIAALRDIHLIYGPQTTIQDLHQRWNGAVIVLTNGVNGSDAFNGKTIYHADAFSVQIVDRVGAGDSFDAGLICALLDGKPLGEALRFGNALAALKMTLQGDIAVVTKAEIEHLLSSGSSLIQR
jgi:2-dehydro-3-deoxygluconokinase